MKRPEQFAGDHVEAAHVFGCGLLAVAAIAGAGRIPRHHDDVADHQRPGAVVEAPGQRLAIDEAQAHASLIAEPLNGAAGVRVGGVEILTTDRQDALIGIVRASTPIIDTARGGAGRVFPGRRKGLLLPHRPPGFPVERDHQTVRILGVEHTVDRDRRRTEIRVRSQIRERGHEPGIHRRPPPDNAEAADIVTADLIEGRIASERFVAAEVAPFGVRRGRLRGDQRADRHRGGQRGGGRHHSLDVCHGSSR